jgi:hypothetical protein
MTRLLRALSLVVAVALPASLVAKGPTTKITLVNYSVLSAPVDITDDAVLRKFQVWAGPGVTTGRGGTTTEETDGFIVDWAAGIVAEHPRELPHFEVLFYADSSDTPVYSVSYEPDFSKGQGYIYVPGPGDRIYPRNSATILHGHGFEGHWLRASTEWQNTATALLAPSAGKH